MEPNLTIKTPAEWKNYGNKQFVLKQYTEAIQAYTNGLNLCNSKDQDMLANRAAAYINLERYALALNDASAVLSSDQSHEKAIYRKVKSLLGLSRCEEAVSFLRDEIFKSNQRPNKELLDLFAKAESMLDQQMSQVYDVSEYFGETEVRIDNWAEYRGPVEIVHIPGKGRGLLATEDMVQGQLVMAQRAFNILFLDVDKEERFEDSILEHVEVKSNHDFSGRLLVQRVYNKLKAAPEFGDEFYQLYAGPKLGSLYPSKDDCSIIDIERISGVVRHNCFADSGDSYPEVEKSVGVWLLPSYFNHLCIGGNCFWKIYGDFILIRAFREIKKGEELIFSYASPTWSHKSRMDLLINRLGFTCDCQLCTLDNQLDPKVIVQREKLQDLVKRQEIDFVGLDGKSSPEEIYRKFQISSTLLQEIIRKLEQLHPNHGDLNVSIIDALEKLGMKYFGVGQFEKSAELMQRAHSIMMKLGLPHGAIESMLWVVGSHLQLGDTKTAKYWIEVLKRNAILAHGTVKVLKVMGEWVLEAMAEQGVEL